MNRIAPQWRLAIRLVGTGCAAALVWTLGARPSMAQRAHKARPEKPTSQAALVLPIVMLYPPDAKAGPATEISDVLTDVEQSRLELTNKYHALFFLKSIPSVSRAVAEQVLKTDDITAPFTSDAKIRRVTEAAGYRFALVSSVDDYEYDATKGQISMVISGRLLDLSATPPTMQSGAFSGSSAPKAAHGEDDLAAAGARARNLTEQLMTALLKPPAPARPSGSAANTTGGR